MLSRTDVFISPDPFMRPTGRPARLPMGEKRMVGEEPWPRFWQESSRFRLTGAELDMARQVLDCDPIEDGGDLALHERLVAGITECPEPRELTYPEAEYLLNMATAAEGGLIRLLVTADSPRLAPDKYARCAAWLDRLHSRALIGSIRDVYAGSLKERGIELAGFDVARGEIHRTVTVTRNLSVGSSTQNMLTVL